MLQLTVGAEKFREDVYFQPIFIRYSSTCDGSPKTTDIITNVEDAKADPHQGLIPGQAFHVHELTGAEYVGLMGKKSIPHKFLFSQDKRHFSKGIF